MKIFAYLREEGQVRAVLAAAMGLRARAILFWPGSNASCIGPLQAPNVRAVSEPVQLATVLPTCDAVVNYGSTGIVCQTMLAGKPQLMLPTDTEKWLVSRRVVGCGAGVMARGGVQKQGITAALESLRRGGPIAAVAASLGQSNAARPLGSLDSEVYRFLRRSINRRTAQTNLT